jgi:hypothetical protein
MTKWDTKPLFQKGGEQKPFSQNVGSNTPFSKILNFVDPSTTYPTKGLPLKSFPTPKPILLKGKASC